MEQNKNIINIDINLLIPNRHQPRKYFDGESLKELAQSIKEYGIINPIIVRKINDKYEIIAGERRYRAAKLLGLSEVPVVIKDVQDTLSAQLALIENLQREALNPIDEAEAYEEIMKLTDMKQEELSQRIGKSQSTIANKIRLLSLPIEIKNALKEKKISERHARSLIKVHDENKQIELLNKTTKEKLTVKELEKLIEKNNSDSKEANNAIEEILKLRKEEKKESDNMNNGNFFPNYDNQPQGMSLNAMNMQSMNNNAYPQMPEMAMPSLTPQEPSNNVVGFATATPNINQQGQTIYSNPSMNIPPKEPPLFNNIDSVIQQPPQQQVNYSINRNPEPMYNGIQQPTEPSPYQNQLQDIPLFSNQQEFNPTPIQQPINELINNPLPTPDFLDSIIPNNTPNEPNLSNNDFNNNQQQFEITQEPQTEISKEFASPEVSINPQEDKLTQIIGFLNDLGVKYKSFENDEEHCIIIEI